MSTLNYIDENGNINKAGVIPKNYPASNVSYGEGSVADALDGLKYKVATLSAPINISTQSTEVTATIPELIGAKEVIIFGDNGVAGSVHLIIPKYVARGQAKMLGSLNGYYSSNLNAEVDNRSGLVKFFNTSFGTGGSGATSITEIWYR